MTDQIWKDEAPRLWTITTILRLNDPGESDAFALGTAEGPEILVGIERPGGWAVVDILAKPKAYIAGDRIDRYEGPAAMSVLYQAQNLWAEVNDEKHHE